MVDKQSTLCHCRDIVPVGIVFEAVCEESLDLLGRFTRMVYLDMGETSWILSSKQFSSIHWCVKRIWILVRHFFCSELVSS